MKKSDMWLIVSYLIIGLLAGSFLVIAYTVGYSWYCSNFLAIFEGKWITFETIMMFAAVLTVSKSFDCFLKEEEEDVF